MSERPPLWRRARESKALLAVAMAIVFVGPIYLWLAFPHLMASQMALMQRVSGAHVTDQAELTDAIVRQVAFNAGAWLLPIGVVLLALGFLIARTFVRR